jgi:hypothetical protein
VLSQPSQVNPLLGEIICSRCLYAHKIITPRHRYPRGDLGSRSRGVMVLWFDRWSAVECCGRCASVRARVCGTHIPVSKFHESYIGFF